jgi:hypothetical protein
MNNLYGNGGYYWWLGVVEDRNDPMFLGRCKIRIAGYHNANKVELPIEDLPWAYPMQSINSAAISGVGSAPIGPVEGTWVVGFFLDGEDGQQPVFMGTLAGIPQPDIPGTVEQLPSANTPDNALTTPAGNVVVDAKTGVPVVAPNTETLPTPTGVVGPLSQEDLDKLFKGLRDRESSDNYQAVNKYGYLGAYQFGADLLCDIGYLKSGAKDIWKDRTPDDYAAIALEREIITDTLYANVSNKSKQHFNFFCSADDSVWTTKGGGSAKGFIESREIQDQAILASFKKNYRTLVNRRVLTPSDSKGKVAGYLFVAHLLGPSGAVKLSKGTDGADANGTKGSEYYNIGYRLVDNRAPEKPSQESNTSDNLPAAPSDSAPSVANQPTNESYIQTPPELGFNDPNKVYPRVNYIGEPDTNRLARHHKLQDTVVGTKDNNRVVGVTTALEGDTWDQPPVPYNAKYPFNKVFESEAGHIIEIDDTPGNERIHVYHRSGTWFEIDCNGSFVKRVAGDSYSIMERNGNVLVQGKANVTIEGSANVYVKNDCNLQVDGEMNVEVHGDYSLNVAGKLAMAAGEGIHAKSDKDIALEAKDDFNAKGKNVAVEGLAKTSVKAAGILAMQSGAAAGITAGAKLSLGGLSVALMSPGPPASSAAGADTDSPVDKLSPSEPSFAELIVPTRAEEFAFDLDVLTENYEENGEAIQSEIQRAIDEGLISPEELNQEAIVTDKDDSEAPRKSLVIPGCGDVYTYSDFPTSFRLSPHFNLGMLSSNAAVSKYAVVPQHGLSKQDIVCNLKAIAEQILEPILAKYPNMFVTSGFRSPANSNSQHQRGQAVDIQFRGASKTDYFEIAKWIKQHIPYDQMLLEYKSFGTKMPWIHLSFNRDGCRNVCHTFFNDRMAPGGTNTLVKLA